ncbi:MAG: NUDIX domain-containing protein [Rickettsiales bacterium]|jgi:isopentenyldiphosphate isomerase|nr:NUDIX domain-containing protein [Rickettsiales bacterium]
MAEFLDIYDANKKHIGTADRNVAHAFGLWHKTVHCWIVWRGKMVFQRRSRTMTANAGKLYTTASGHISAGESVEQAFAREIVQEIGISVVNPRQISETTWVADIKKSDGSLFIDRVFANVFWADFDGELTDFHFDDGEVDSVVAVDLDEFVNFARGKSIVVKGMEFDGKTVSEINLAESDFVINEGETLHGKYGANAEYIQNSIH